MAAEVIIEKKNEVYIKLHCDSHILYELQPHFTFTLESAKFMPQFRKTGWNGQINLLSVVTGEIYAGLLDRVIAKIKAHGYTYEFRENRFYGLPFEINSEASPDGTKGYLDIILKQSSPSVNPYDYQINAIYECLRFNRKTIISPTASGKTLIIYALARYYAIKN